MTKFILPLLVISILLQSCKDNGFVINGKLLDAKEGTMIYLDRLGSETLEPFDSVQINKEGYFLVEGEIDMPEFFLIRTSNQSFLTALIEPEENVTIEAYSDSLSYPSFIDGSPGTLSMIQYNKELTRTVDRLGELSEIYNNSIDNPELDQIMAGLDIRAQSIIDEINQYTKEYIDKNLTSMVAMVALYQQVSPGVYVLNPMNDLDYFVKVDSSLFGLYPESEPIISFHNQVEGLVASMQQQSASGLAFNVGDTAPDFSLPDKDGNEISLYSTRGKVVLLDFWAAWCGPCREENPNLVAAYEKYNKKGFEIFQVSLDKTREAWLKGIEDDNINSWIHVSDLKFWESKVVPLYKLEQIPSSFLLDKQGRVVAMNLRGQQLSDVLEELLK